MANLGAQGRPGIRVQAPCSKPCQQKKSLRRKAIQGPGGRRSRGTHANHQRPRKVLAQASDVPLWNARPPKCRGLQTQAQVARPPKSKTEILNLLHKKPRENLTTVKAFRGTTIPNTKGDM